MSVKLTAAGALKALKTFIQREIANKMTFQKEGSDPPEYVHPYVGIMSLPHKNFMPVNFQVPYILIGFTNGEDNVNENAMSIRIQCAIYGGDIKFEKTANIPDETGYIELINLMERIKNRLVQEAVINKSVVVNKPIQYGVYDEQITYPYWYGYLTFEGQIAVSDRQMVEFL